VACYLVPSRLQLSLTSCCVIQVPLRNRFVPRSRLPGSRTHNQGRLHGFVHVGFIASFDHRLLARTCEVCWHAHPRVNPFQILRHRTTSRSTLIALSRVLWLRTRLAHTALNRCVQLCVRGSPQSVIPSDLVISCRSYSPRRVRARRGDVYEQDTVPGSPHTRGSAHKNGQRHQHKLDSAVSSTPAS